MDNFHGAGGNGHEVDGRDHYQRHTTRSENRRYEIGMSSHGAATGQVQDDHRRRGRQLTENHFYIKKERGSDVQPDSMSQFSKGVMFPSASGRSSCSSSVSENVSTHKMRKLAASVYKSMFGHDPDEKAVEEINAFVHSEPDKKNIGIETRCMEKLKIHLIKQGHESDSRRLMEIYQKLKGLPVLKNREATIALMYCLFDKEKTRSIMSKEKAAAQSKRLAQINGNEESIACTSERRGRTKDVQVVGVDHVHVSVKIRNNFTPSSGESPSKCLNNSGTSTIAALDQDYDCAEEEELSCAEDIDPTPIPRLHFSNDNLLNQEMISGSKVPPLVKPRHESERRGQGHWDGDMLSKLEDIRRGTEQFQHPNISKISKGSDESNRNMPTPMSLMGSTPNIFSSTPMHHAPNPGGPGVRQKPFVNLRNIQENRMGSGRSNQGGIAQIFGNMKSVERDLIRDIVFILQGIDGQYIKATENGTYEIDKRLIIHPALRMQTLKLCEMGYCYTIIRNYCDQPTAGLVAQGFKQAMERELQEFYRLLAIIQAKIQQTIVDTPLSEDPSSKRGEDNMTMLKLSIWLFECRPRLQVLSGMVNCCQTKRGGDLCSTIYKYSQHGDPLVSSLTVSLLSVICKPLYIMLSQWILYGELEDPFNEFFIAADPHCKREQLWHLKYAIRSQMLPSFISKKQAEKILAIGKNINFLKEICNNAEGFEGRYEIKALLETGEVESLFMGENSPIQYAIEMSYKKTSEKVLKVLIDDSRLLDHLKAIKKYLLLGQGDFIQYFLELIQDELSKPAAKLYNHNISAILESAVRATNAQFENEDVLSRLDHRILPASDKDVGWDVFCLDYKAFGPIGTVLTEDVMTSYNKLFNGLWRTKRIEIILSSLWKNQTVVFKYLRLIPELAPVLHRSQLLISEMIHFVHQTQYYIMFEATECAWEKLMEDVNKAEDLDAVISSHHNFLNTIFQRSLLDSGSRELLNQLRGIFDSVYELRSFLAEFNERVETEVKSRKQLAPNSDEGRDAQKQFFSSYVMKAKGKIETLYTTTQDLVRTFLLVLNKQQDLTLQCLSFRLDFNEYYHQKDARLTLPLTYQHRRRSSAAFNLGNLSGSFSTSNLMTSSSIHEANED